MKVSITASVGKGSVNNSVDVRKVQNLLNRWISPRFLSVDGVCNGTEGDRTVEEIKKFQSSYMAVPDGRVDPNGGTLRKLQTKWKQLPQNFGFGSGYYQYGRSADIGARQWGSKKTIETIVRVCKQFQMQQRTITNQYNLASYGLVGVGDISFKFGGYMSPHGTHQEGLNVDMRPCRKDVLQTPVNIFNDQYDSDRTKLLIELFLADPNVKSILFNDPKIYKLPRVSKYEKHDDHFHITMYE